MARVKVVGYMPIDQFEEDELDKSRPSGLSEDIEEGIADDIGEHLDDITMTYEESDE